MKLIDSHCHIEAQEFDQDRTNVIEDGIKSGIIKFITSAVFPEQWQKSIDISTTYPQVECTIGVHPWYVKEEYFPELDNIPTIVKKHKIVAIGEIGLDRKIKTPPFELQEAIFEKQLKIAKQLNLPVVIHCRGAFPDLIRIVKKTGLPNRGALIHAYKGSPEITKQLLPLGFFFSFGCALTYPHSYKKANVIKMLYPDRILIETDSPDIPPAGKTNERNIPSNLLLVINELSKFLEKAKEEIADTTTQNANNLFSLNI